MNLVHNTSLPKSKSRLNFLLLLLMVPSLLIGCQDTPDLVQADEFSHPLHEKHLGKIVFTEGLLPLDQLDESDLLDSFLLEEGSNLAMTAFQGNSLVNYLHPLDRNLRAQELANSGNYQFTFFVDDEQVYQENLNFGAGLFDQKSKQVILHAPLASNQGEDYWSRFLWMRFFMRDGGEAALKNGPHNFRIEMRPYLDHGEIVVGEIIAEGDITLSLPKPIPATEDEIAVQAIAPNSGWALSDASFDKGKIRELNKGIAEKDFKEINGIVVIKDGRLLIEEYFNGEDRSSLHDPRSVGKTFASTITGIALQEGHLESVDQNLADFYDLSSFDNNSPEKAAVTIKSLLTMSSGIDGTDEDMDSPGNEEYMYPTDDWVKFALDLPMDSKKEIGKNWDYFTAGAVVLGDILHKAVPGGLDAYTDAKLFKPLNITDYQWQYTPTEVANTAGGLRLSALDFAKFGQLYKNGGIWGDDQILTQSWVKESLSNYFLNPEKNEGYGYLFWRQTFEIEGKSHEAFLCTGNGGNKIFVFTDLPLVIVITASAYGRPYAHPQVDRMMTKYILPAVIN